MDYNCTFSTLRFKRPYHRYNEFYNRHFACYRYQEKLVQQKKVNLEVDQRKQKEFKKQAKAR